MDAVGEPPAAAHPTKARRVRPVLTAGLLVLVCFARSVAYQAWDLQLMSHYLRGGLSISEGSLNSRALLAKDWARNRWRRREAVYLNVIVLDKIVSDDLSFPGDSYGAAMPGVAAIPEMGIYQDHYATIVLCDTTNDGLELALIAFLLPDVPLTPGPLPPIIAEFKWRATSALEMCIRDLQDHELDLNAPAVHPMDLTRLARCMLLYFYDSAYILPRAVVVMPVGRFGYAFDGGVYCGSVLATLASFPTQEEVEAALVPPYGPWI